MNSQQKSECPSFPAFPQSLNPIKKLKQRFKELWAQLDTLESTKKIVTGSLGQREVIDTGMFTSWKVKVKNLLVIACGENSQHFKAFIEGEKPSSMESEYSIKKRLGAIFEAAKEDFEGGYLVSLKQLVQAEFFESELEQAEELLNNKRWDIQIFFN